MESCTRVQIYTMQSVAEAEAVAALGVDHVGVTPSHRGLPGEVDEATAVDICAALTGLATSVALSVETDAEAVERMAAMVQPDILHLCGPPGEMDPGRRRRSTSRFARSPDHAGHRGDRTRGG